MKNKIVLLFITAVLTWNTAKAQTNINDYKYVIVPNTFDFLKEPDQYRLNTLTKLLFEKHGFTAIMEKDTFPDEAISNGCLALHADVLKESGVFNSKLKVELKDCQNNIVFVTNIGKSKEKNYEVAYNLALREAFKSFDTFKYQYKENETILSYGKKDAQESKDEIEKLKEEIKILKEEKEVVAEVVVKEVVAVKKEEIKEEVNKEIIAEKPVKEETENGNVLYAQKMENGYQLVDSTPKVVYKIKKTGMQNVYLVEGKDAILYQLNNNWVLEYYDNGKLQTKTLTIKF